MRLRFLSSGALPRPGVGLGLLSLLYASVGSLHAQQSDPSYVYSVSYECGYQASADGRDGYEPLVKVANYATKVDLQNVTPVEVTVRGEVVDTTYDGVFPASNPGTALGTTTLPVLSASVIDCSAIAAALGVNVVDKPFLSGMLAVHSTVPLSVWTTKTTQVCLGTAAWVGESPPPLSPYQPIYLDDGLGMGPKFFLEAPTTGPTLTYSVDWSTLGCPAARYAYLPEGVRPGNPPPPSPAFYYPKGLSPIGLIFRPPTVDNPDGEATPANMSISHSLDTEQVQPIVLGDGSGSLQKPD